MGMEENDQRSLSPLEIIAEKRQILLLLLETYREEKRILPWLSEETQSLSSEEEIQSLLSERKIKSLLSEEEIQILLSDEENEIKREALLKLQKIIANLLHKSLTEIKSKREALLESLEEIDRGLDVSTLKTKSELERHFSSLLEAEIAEFLQRCNDNGNEELKKVLFLEIIDEKLTELFQEYTDKKMRSPKFFEPKNNREVIEKIKDLIGDGKPSKTFWLQLRMFGYLLSNDPDKTLSKWGVILRRIIHPLIAKSCPKFLSHPQVIENKRFLLSREIAESIELFAESIELFDESIKLPNKPVIWALAHSFPDDVLAAISVILRHTYILFGSLPQFYNSLPYGLPAQLGGVVIVNRNNKESRRASLKKIKRLFEYGADILMCPEATWNKTPSLLQLEYWAGVYDIAKENRTLVVPVVHYITDPFDPKAVIHTVIGDPLNPEDYLGKEEFLEALRDQMSTWYYLMMEKYGRTTRDELLNGQTSDEYWMNCLERLIGCVQFYDTGVERKAYFSNKPNVKDVFGPIADLPLTSANYRAVTDAIRIRTTRDNDFYQRRS